MWRLRNIVVGGMAVVLVSFALKGWQNFDTVLDVAKMQTTKYVESEEPPQIHVHFDDGTLGGSENENVPNPPEASGRNEPDKIPYADGNMHATATDAEPKHNVIKSKTWWSIEYNDNVLSCEIRNKEKSQSRGSSARENVDNATSSSLMANKFVIHVHGLQHTGTGYLRMILHDVLGAESNVSLQHGPGFEDEGQHMQSIYPRGHDRMAAWKKSKSYNITQFLYMPDLCSIPNATMTGEVLMQQWSKYWDMSQYYLIQKTPFMDVGFLEHIKISPTFHAIIMRHPLAFSKFFASHKLNNPMDYLLVWLDSWAHTLSLLANGNVVSYAVVTYESLVLYRKPISDELLQLIEVPQNATTANSDFNNYLTQNHRKLELHHGKNSSKYLKPSRATTLLWEKCIHNEKCQDLLQEMKNEIFPYMGYESTMLGPHPVRVGENFGRILFSSSSPPPLDLLHKMNNILVRFSLS